MADSRAFSVAKLDDQSWASLGDAVERFEASWQTTPGAELAPFVPSSGGPLRKRVLIELIKVDQEYSWRSGERRTLEAYLSDWPELRSNREAVVELLEGECLTRTVFDGLPTLDELRSRFPKLCHEIDLDAIDAKAETERPSGRKPAAPLAASDTSDGTAHEIASKPDVLPLRVGNQFGRYEIRGLLGRGGTATVYRAYDGQLGREVALKIPRFDPAAEPTVLERLVREGRAAAAIRHPNICPIFDAGQVEGTYYVTMALIEGASLAAWIQEGRAIAPCEAAGIVQKLAQASDRAHASGIVHRDIKPSNVMIDEAGEPVLMDFGLARQAQDAAITTTGSLVGTPAYMSPEQVRGEHEQVDHQTDIYGLGVLLYHLLTGRLPFSSPLPRVLAEIERGKPPRPRSVRPELDRVLEAICLKAMATRPADRYQSAGEMAAALEEYLGSERQAAKSPPRRTRRLLLGAAGGALVLLAGVLVYLNTGEGTLVLNVNEPDVQLAIDGQRQKVEIRSPRDRIDVTVSAGQHQLEVTKDGFTSYTREFRIFRGGKAELSAKLLPLSNVEAWRPSTGRLVGREPGSRAVAVELAALAERIEAGVSDDPQDEKVVALREELVDFNRRHVGTPEAIRAAELMAQLPWPADNLRRDEIPSYELQVAGGGDPTKAPPELVAIWGDSRLNHWTGWVPSTHSIAFHPEGHTVATAGGTSDGTVRLWDIATGKQERVFVHSHVLGAAFSPDGTRIASVSEGEGGSVKLWETATGREILVFPGHSGYVGAVAFSPDANTVASGGITDKTVRLWDTDTGRERATLNHGASIQSLAFSVNGEILASGGGGMAKLWKMPSGEPLRTFTREDDSGTETHVALSTDGKLLAAGSAHIASPNGLLTVWEVSTGKQLLSLEEEVLRGFPLAFSPDSRTLAIGSGAGLKRFDVTSWRKLPTIPAGSVKCLAFSPDGKLIASRSSGAPGLRIWDAATGEEHSSARGELCAADICPLAISLDGRILAGASRERIRLWDMASGRELEPPLGHQGQVNCLAYSPDGRLLAWGSEDGTVTLWDALQQRPHASFRHPLRVRSVAFSPDGKTLASASWDKSVKLWDLATGSEIATLRGHTGSVNAVAFSPDGLTLASASGAPDGKTDQTVRLWNVATGQTRQLLEGPPIWHLCLAFSPDGRLVASGGHGLKVWDADTGELRFYRPSGITIFSLAFSPDGRTIAAASSYGMLQFWNAQDGESQSTLRLAPGGNILNLTYTPDGRHLVTANGNGTIYILRLASVPLFGAK